jgi:hypothetical protein
MLSLWCDMKHPPQVHVLNAWSPTGGPILGDVETLGGVAWLEEVVH